VEEQCWLTWWWRGAGEASVVTLQTHSAGTHGSMALLVELAVRCVIQLPNEGADSGNLLAIVRFRVGCGTRRTEERSG